MFPARPRIQFVNVASLFKHHRTRPGIKRLHIEIGELRGLRQLLCPCVERPDISHAIAIRNEIDGVPNPRRIHILRVRPRWRDQVKSLKIHNPDGAVLPAAIVPALFVPRVIHAISDPLAIGRNLALIGARQRQRFFDAALCRNRPESGGRRRRGGGARGCEDDAPAVRRPSLNGVRCRVPRQAPRFTAGGGRHVDIGVARVLPAERNPFSVG